MNTQDINTIAFQYLLRTDSKKNNIAEESNEVLQYNPEHYMNTQKSLFFEMYAAEDEALFI